MQIIRLETNRSSAVPRRRELPSLMSRVEPEYSYLFFNSTLPSPHIRPAELALLSLASARLLPGTRRIVDRR